MTKAAERTSQASAGGRRLRHALADRLFHWLTAAAVLVLLATAFLPILGLEFAWVSVHWITGLALTALVLAHIVRALFWQDPASMWISLCDIRDGLSQSLAVLRNADAVHKVAGKYSLAQKAIHHAFTLVVLMAIGTGFAMLAKVDTPWWERDPYWLSDATWAVVYVLHDLASLCLLTMIIVHVYFALRPEKLYLTRSMIVGWITGRDYERHYDASRWLAEGDAGAPAAARLKRE